MAIRFKFRSSVNFDSVDIDPLPSISVRDLKAKILAKKNLKIFQDFDLVITDAVSGLEYNNEDSLIPSGSSVVIKRVPPGRSAPEIMPSIDVVQNLGNECTNLIASNGCSPAADVEIENFDDFGTDLCPVLEASLLDSDVNVDEVNCRNSINLNAITRFSEPSIVRCQNRDPSDLSDAIQKGAMPCGVEGPTLQTNLQPKNEKLKIFDEVVKPRSPVMERPDIPSELRCSLCKTIFNEAVMIPCCQHSFCEKCIHMVLVEKKKCPKCFSSRCRVEDLLPNVSLRQAIEHFLEAQVLNSGSDNILSKYVPDGESGIQVKETSCAGSIYQREPVLPHSPSATGKGSNQVMLQSEYEPNMRKNRSAADNDAAASTVKKRKGLCINPVDGNESYTAISKQRKGDRTCYMCGSPDHFIRDCPVASGSYSTLQTGDGMFPGSISAYGPSYWHGGPSFPAVRPFMNMYATPSMMPYEPTMVPVGPFGASSYVPSMYGGIPVPWLVRMGAAVPPMVTGANHPVSRAGFMEHQNSEKKQKPFNEHTQRERLHNEDVTGDYYHEHRQSHESRLKPLRESSVTYYQDRYKQTPQKKHPPDEHLDEDSYPMDRKLSKVSSPTAGRECCSCQCDATSSGVQDISHSSGLNSKQKYVDHSSKKRSLRSSETRDVSDSSNQYSREKQRHHGSTKKSERKKHGVHDSSHRSHHDKKQLEADDGRKHSKRHHSVSQSVEEPSSSEDWKREKRREKESGISSKPSRRGVKTADGLRIHERWEMVNGYDEDYRDEYHHHQKRKRIH